MSTIYYNGNIITLEEPLYAEAVYTDNGIIKAVGSFEYISSLKQPDTHMYDLHGKTLIPAFIDSHSHITAYASTLAYVNLSTANNFQEILQILNDFRLKTSLPDDKWLIGFGYDHNFLSEHTHPDKILLDSLNIPNPIIITHTSGHMAVLNSKALQLVNINKDTHDPNGGRIGRIFGTTEPNGYIEESALMSVSKYVSATDKDTLIPLIERAQSIYAGYGITTIQDGLMSDKDLSLLSSSHLFIDIIGYIDMNKYPEMLPPDNNYNNHLKIQGYKIILDGSPQGKTAWLSKPYEDSDECGYPVYTNHQVTDFFVKAITEHRQILVHCNGDAATQQFIDCYEQAMITTKADYSIRPVMIHAQLLRKDQLPKIKALGIIPSYFVAHTYYWGDIHINNLGERAYKISPTASTENLEIPFTLHQDTPVVEPDMLHTIWCAVNRITKSNIPIGKEECISPLSALKAVTLNSAYQYFEEDIKGSIAIGKQANFTILSHNPLTVPHDFIKDIKVLTTIDKGKVVYNTTDK